MRSPIRHRLTLALLTHSLLLGLLVLLVACGGGSGSGGGGPPPPTVTGNGFAPTTGPGDTGSYFPVGAGDAWLADVTTTDPKASAPSGTGTVTVTGTTTIKGATATIFSVANSTSVAGPFNSYFSVSNGGVTNLGNNNPGDTLSPLIIPYGQLLFPVQVGQVSNVVGQNLAFGKDAAGNPITLDLTQTISNAAMETVDVPAGTFTNAIKQTTTVNATAHDGTQSVPITGNETTWYAPGVGEVKDQTTASSGGTTISSTTDLRRYTINGTAHGIGASGSLDASLVTANCQTSSQPMPSAASDGTNFLVVAYACSAASGTVQANWIGLLLGSDGTMLKSVNITAPSGSPGIQPYLHSVVGFDGAHYLVMYEDPSAGTSAPLWSVVLGTDTSVLAGPTMVGTQSLPTGTATTDTEALGFDGSRFLLIYTQGATGPGTVSQVYGQFLTPGTGLPAGAAFTISVAGGSPAIAFDGTNYLVAWADTAAGALGLHARRVSTAGGLPDAADLVLADLTAATLSEPCCDLEPTIAYDGTNYLVAYRDPRSGPSNSGYASISAARVSTAGVLLDGTTTTPGIVIGTSKTASNTRVRSVFMGGTYWLVWESGYPLTQLSATRVSTSGVVASAWTDGFTIVPPQTYTEIPRLTSSSNGSLLTWVQVNSIDPNAGQTQLMGLRIYP